MIDESTRGGSVGDDAQIYRTLANERRRHGLTLLRSPGNSLALTALARRGVERETGDDAATPTGDVLQNCRASSYHSHLPRLADLGLVEFDADRQVAALTPDVGVDP